MFTLWKKKKEYNPNRFYAFVDGTVLSLEQVKDEVFSSKIMGDGMAIIPTSNQILAPCSGVLSMVFPTLHAFGITMDNGVEILIHIGLNTLELNRKGFTQLVDTGTRVEIGTPIIQADLSFLKQQGYDTTSMLIVVKPNNYCFAFKKEGTVIGGTDSIAAIAKGETQ